MSASSPSSCADFALASTLSRRRFMAGVAAAGATAVSTSLFGDAVRQASFGATNGNVLVVVSCRGGMDGLGMVVPHGDAAYYLARPSIALPQASLFGADAMFGMHPKLAPLQWLWESGELAAVHAVGKSDLRSRSHFAAMEEIEDADPGSETRQGWVNRMVGLDSAASQAISFGAPTPPTITSGPNPSLAAASLAEMELNGTSNGWRRSRRRQLKAAWKDDQGPLGAAARSALRTVQDLQPVATASYAPTAAYPTSQPGADLAEALRDTAHLVKAQVGVEVVTIDFGSWDMHDQYGNVENGQMQKMTAAFAESVAAFMRDLGALRSRVTLVTISEFGRRVAENGNRGLDHGYGNAMLLLGGGVRGGRYYGSWPGLGAGTLVDGDLRVTTDYRQVLGEIVHRRFPDKDVSRVFPGVAYDPLGVMAAT